MRKSSSAGSARAWLRLGEEVAITKRRAYLDWVYWGRPVPSFGDPNARLLIVGLAPAAHGANRTGRMFTGDRSGDFLYRALFEAAFANQPESQSANDGLLLNDAFVTAPVRCAPPDNKPTTGEILNCRPFLERELALLRRVRVVVALGGIAFTQYLIFLQKQKIIPPAPHSGSATGAYTGRTKADRC